METNCLARSRFALTRIKVRFNRPTPEIIITHDKLSRQIELPRSSPGAVGRDHCLRPVPQAAPEQAQTLRRDQARRRPTLKGNYQDGQALPGEGSSASVPSPHSVLPLPHQLGLPGRDEPQGKARTPPPPTPAAAHQGPRPAQAPPALAMPSSNVSGPRSELGLGPSLYGRSLVVIC